MSFYSTLTSALHRVQDSRASGSGASDYALQTSADFGNLYWATVSLLSKGSLLDYVAHTREGDKCRFRFKHDSWFSDTDTDMSVSANVKLSLVEGKGVSVVAVFGLSGLSGFTDTIRGYVASGDLANVIASWFKTLSYDGKARSFYIDAWDDFSTALSNISEHPGFASAVKDAAASQSLEYPFKGSAVPAEFSSAKEALSDMYDELTDRALRWYSIEFTDVTRRVDYFTVAFTRTIFIPTSKSRPVRNPHAFVLCDVCLRVDSADGKKLQATVTVGIQSISEEVSYKSEYAGSGYINTVRATLTSPAQVDKFIKSFLSLLGELQADGYEYDHYTDQVEKFAGKVSSKSAVSDGEGSAPLSQEAALSLVREHADEIMRAANIPYTKVTSVTPQGDVWVFRYINKAGVPMAVNFGRDGEGSSMGRSIAVKSRVIRDLLSGAHSVSDAASIASSLKGITPIESSFGGSILYRVLLWPGRGYTLDSFYVKADSAESALEALSSYLIKEGLTSYYSTESQYEDYLSQVGISEEEDTSYIYIDGTMEGAPYPIYLLSENMRIEEV